MSVNSSDSAVELAATVVSMSEDWMTTAQILMKFDSSMHLSYIVVTYIYDWY